MREHFVNCALQRDYSGEEIRRKIRTLVFLKSKGIFF